MTTWNKEIGAMTLMAPDLDRSKEFYQKVFGLPAMMEEPDSVMFRFTSMYVFLHKSAAPVQPPEAKKLALAGAGQFAIIVDDVKSCDVDTIIGRLEV